MTYVDPTVEPAAQDMRAPRQQRLFCAQLSERSGISWDIVIRNVSEKGVGASTKETPPKVGTDVTLTLPDGATACGAVRWVNNKSFGIELAQSIDLSMLTTAIQRKNETQVDESQWEVSRLQKIITVPIDPSRLRKI
ncbi:MAG: PilZ domain-containing protein [Sphingomonadaceae bacterium]|nr:PilZ domain-containing protein [Sphingomonadaceae bacterium]